MRSRVVDLAVSGQSGPHDPRGPQPRHVNIRWTRSVECLFIPECFVLEPLSRVQARMPGSPWPLTYIYTSAVDSLSDQCGQTMDEFYIVT